MNVDRANNPFRYEAIGFLFARKHLAVMLALLAGSASAYYAPTYHLIRAPFNPTSDAECDDVRRRLAKESDDIYRAHDDCLKGAPNDDGPNAGKTCTKSACQGLHDMRSSIGDYAREVNNTCRERLDKYKDAKRKEEDTARRAQADEQRRKQERERADKERRDTSSAAEKLGKAAEYAGHAKGIKEDPRMHGAATASDKMGSALTDATVNSKFPLKREGKDSTYDTVASGVDAARSKALSGNPFAEKIASLAGGALNNVNRKTIGEMDNAAEQIRNFNPGRSDPGATTNPFRPTPIKSYGGKTQEESESSNPFRQPHSNNNASNQRESAGSGNPFLANGNSSSNGKNEAQIADTGLAKNQQSRYTGQSSPDWGGVKPDSVVMHTLTPSDTKQTGQWRAEYRMQYYDEKMPSRGFDSPSIVVYNTSRQPLECRGVIRGDGWEKEGSAYVSPGNSRVIYRRGSAIIGTRKDRDAFSVDCDVSRNNTSGTIVYKKTSDTYYDYDARLTIENNDSRRLSCTLYPNVEKNALYLAGDGRRAKTIDTNSYGLKVNARSSAYFTIEHSTGRGDQDSFKWDCVPDK